MKKKQAKTGLDELLTPTLSGFLAGQWARCEGGLCGNEVYENCILANGSWMRHSVLCTAVVCVVRTYVDWCAQRHTTRELVAWTSDLYTALNKLRHVCEATTT